MTKITVMLIVCVTLAYLSEKQTNAIHSRGHRYSVWKDPAYLALVVVLVLFAGLRTNYNDSPLSSKQKDFYEEHSAELELFEAASRELREIFEEEKLPTLQALKQEKSELSKKKETQYESFKTLRSRWMELSKLVRNRDSLMQNMETERGNKPII